MSEEMDRLPPTCPGLVMKHEPVHYVLGERPDQDPTDKRKRQRSAGGRGGSQEEENNGRDVQDHRNAPMHVGKHFQKVVFEQPNRLVFVGNVVLVHGSVPASRLEKPR